MNNLINFAKFKIFQTKINRNYLELLSTTLYFIKTIITKSDVNRCGSLQ